MTRALPSWRATVGGAVVAAALMAPAMASGAGRTYEVVQCDPLNRGVAGAALEDAPSYAVKQGCGDPKEDHAIKISNTRFAQQGRSGRVRWSTQSPSLGIVGASVQANLRRDRGHVARLWMADADGDELAKVAAGSKNATGFRHYSWHSSGPRAEQFIAHLRCDHRGGCKHSEVAKTWLRDLHFEVADYSDPRLAEWQVARSSVRGWLRERQSLIVQSSDAGSGLRAPHGNRERCAVSHASLGHAMPSASVLCDPFRALRSVATATGPARHGPFPFHDGANFTSLCGLDFAPIATCDDRLVRCRQHAARYAHSRTTRTRAILNSFAPDGGPARPEWIRVRSTIVPAGAGPWRPLSTQRRSGRASRAGRLDDGSARAVRVHGTRLGCGRQQHGHDPALERTANDPDFPAEVRRLTCRPTFRWIASAYRRLRPTVKGVWPPT